MTVSSDDAGGELPPLPAGLDLLDFPPPPALTRQSVASRDELLPGAEPFLPVPVVVNGEQDFTPLVDGLVGYDIWDILEESEDDGYVTEHENIDSSDDEDDDDEPPFPPCAA